MSFLIDTSIPTRLKDLSNPHQQECWNVITFLRANSIPVYICTQVLIEYWNVCTRPTQYNGLGQTIQETYQDCQDLFELFKLLSEPADITDRWLELVNRYEVKGKQVHDARMAAFAWSYGIPRILTLNPSDFERYTELTALTPKEVV
jgi:predicted nucleic acid-binding protein